MRRVGPSGGYAPTVKRLKDKELDVRYYGPLPELDLIQTGFLGVTENQP